MLVNSIVDRHVSHFGTWEDVDFPKVLKNSARPGERAEKSVDLHEVLNYLARDAEKSATIVAMNFLSLKYNREEEPCDDYLVRLGS